MCDTYSNFDDIKKNISSPRYRIQRVNKLLLYPILNITKDVVSKSKTAKPCAKVLAINKNNKEILRSNKSKINLIASNVNYKTLNKTQRKIIDIDLNASTLYNTIFDNKLIGDKKIGTMFL